MLLAAVFVGSDSLVLSNACGRAEVSLVGAQVTSYVPAGGEEVLFMPQDRDFSRNREMHGGIPVCWPWFGRCGEPGSRIHGLARYCRWTLAERTDSNSLTRVVLKMDSSEETRQVWPHDFALRYEIELGSRLDLRLVASNLDKRPFGVTAGFHPYFRVADPGRVVVRGMSDPVNVYPGIDKGFYTPSNGRYGFATGFSEIEMTAKGECRLIVWNPGPDPSDWCPENNLGRGDWRHFVCVEPTISRRDHAVELDPGQSHMFQMTLSSKPTCGNCGSDVNQ